MNFFSVLLASFAVLLLVPSGVLLVQVLASLLQAKRPLALVESTTEGWGQPYVRILMPAHDEAGGIASVVLAMLPQLGPRTRLLVVADNCTDPTASIARSVAGPSDFVEVIERHDPERRGKGYALDYGVRYLSADPPQILIVLDADCTLRTGSVQVLADLCMRTGRPIQALDLMQAPDGSSTRTRLAEFAWMFKNKVRALGFYRLALPCQLMGTGMAFTWKQISEAKLATGNIVEDMQLGIDLALQGTPPLFCPTALVTSLFPSDVSGLKTQRARWEHGHLGVIFAQGPKLLAQSIFHRSGALLAMALDLCVPPLAFLVLAIVATLAASVILVATGGSILPANLALASLVMMIISVMLAWRRFGREVISLKELCNVPLYVLAKLPLYVFFVFKRQSNWVRSKRDDDR